MVKNRKSRVIWILLALLLGLIIIIIINLASWSSPKVINEIILGNLSEYQKTGIFDIYKIENFEGLYLEKLTKIYTPAREPASNYALEIKTSKKLSDFLDENPYIKGNFSDLKLKPKFFNPNSEFVRGYYKKSGKIILVTLESMIFEKFGNDFFNSDAYTEEEINFYMIQNFLREVEDLYEALEENYGLAREFPIYGTITLSIS